MAHSNQHDNLLEVVHALRQTPHDVEGRTAHFSFSTKQQLKKRGFWRTQIVESTVHVAMFAEDVGRSQDGIATCELVCDQIYAAILAAKNVPLAERLAHAIQRANHALYTRTQTDVQMADARVSIVVAATVNGELHLAHVGNSRAYLIRNGEAHLLTVDHTTEQEMISRGLLFLTDAENPESHEDVTRCLGLAEDVEVDHGILQPSVRMANSNALPLPRLLEFLPLEPTDVVALCSNGISDTLTEEEIASAIAEMDWALVDVDKTTGGDGDEAIDGAAMLSQAAQRLVQAVDDTAAAYATDARADVEAATAFVAHAHGAHRDCRR